MNTAVAPVPEKRSPFWKYVALIFGGFLVVGTILQQVIPLTTPAPLAPASVEVANFGWAYQRPYFLATVIIRNSGEKPINEVQLGIRFQDTMRGKTVGIEANYYNLHRPLTAGETRQLVVRAHAPDLPVYLVQNLVPMSAIKGEVIELKVIR